MKKIQYLRKEIVKSACLGFILLSTICLLLGTITKVNAVNASEPEATDLERIQIGKAAPDFNLESTDGEWVRLSSYKNQKNVILVFFRGWW